MRFYRCFSNKLKEFLMAHDLRYELIARDCVTDKTFWLFENTATFEKLLKEWSDNPLKK